MPIVKLNIDDKEFKIECADGEENLLRKAESKLNSEIKSHPEFKNLSDSKKYLMISLIIASKENTNIKENITRQLLTAVKETSIDCALHNNEKESLACYNFGNPTPDKFSFVPSIENDEVDKVAKLNVKTETFSAKKVSINGTDYAVNMETMDVYTLESYIETKKKKRENPIKIGKLVEKNGKFKLQYTKVEKS